MKDKCFTEFCCFLPTKQQKLNLFEITFKILDGVCWQDKKWLLEIISPTLNLIRIKTLDFWRKVERAYGLLKEGINKYIHYISEKAMAPQSSTLAWKIPWMEEPGRLQSMGLLRVRQDWATSLSLFTFMHWRRKWQPTPVFLPGESQGRGSLVGCRLWGRTELDTTDAT